MHGDVTMAKVLKLREEYKQITIKQQEEFKQLELACHATQQNLAIAKRTCDRGNGTNGLGDKICDLNCSKSYLFYVNRRII